ncbi:MAG: hypothetical protein ACRDE7_03105 [Sphingobacterium sp.]
MSNIPEDYTFPPHYMNDGLRSFNIIIEDDLGNPVDLTGALVRMQLSTSNTTQPPNPAFTFSTELEGDALLTLAQGAQGIITFEQVNSLTLAAGKYYYDLEVTDEGGFVTTYLKGTWEIIRDITR